jgi:hypothetical protein
VLLQVSQRCIFNVFPLGLFFFGASWGLVRRSQRCKPPPTRTSALSSARFSHLAFKRVCISSTIVMALAAQVGSVVVVALLYYLDHPYPFKNGAAVAPLAQQMESREQ